MTDKLSGRQRSANMAAIKSANTKPEMLVRSLVHRLGYRFRLHQRDLPGVPDLVFRKMRKAIFVHGCFWHQHEDCNQGRIPNTRQEYWIPKLTRNVLRDAEHLAELHRMGWRTLVLWECEIEKGRGMERQLTRFLGPRAKSG